MKTVRDIIDKHRDMLESLFSVYEQNILRDNDADSHIKYRLIGSILYEPMSDKKRIELVNRLYNLLV